MSKTFQFYSEFSLPVLLGLKAANFSELLDGIKIIPQASIYYHTHKFLKQYHFLVPEPPNDFAYWIRNVQKQLKLGERIASVNIQDFHNIEDLRNKFIGILKSHKETSNGNNCNEGDEFQFMSCKTFYYPLKYKAKNLKQFTDILGKVNINSFYYHIFESRLRRKQERNDFAEWFEKIGEKKLAEEISEIDPYTSTLEGLRNQIIKLIEVYAGN